MPQKGGRKPTAAQLKIRRSPEFVKELQRQRAMRASKSGVAPSTSPGPIGVRRMREANILRDLERKRPKKK
jgi:hypothetical protein